MMRFGQGALVVFCSHLHRWAVCRDSSELLPSGTTTVTTGSADIVRIAQVAATAAVSTITEQPAITTGATINIGSSSQTPGAVTAVTTRTERNATIAAITIGAANSRARTRAVTVSPASPTCRTC